MNISDLSQSKTFHALVAYYNKYDHNFSLKNSVLIQWELIKEKMYWKCTNLGILYGKFTSEIEHISFPQKITVDTMGDN